MQLNFSYKSLLKLVSTIILFFGFALISGNFLQKALALNGYEDFTREELEYAIYQCPEVIQKRLLDEQKDGTRIYYTEGSVVMAKDPVTGRPTELVSCASLKDTEKLFVRLYSVVVSIVGLAFSFGAGKSAIMMMAAGTDSEVFENGAKSLKVSLGSLLGFFFIYIALTFILTGVLGVGTNKSGEWNLLCQQKIVFDLTFGDTKPQCTK